MNNPHSVICPECHAAVGAKCARKVRDGAQYIETCHIERLALANPLEANDAKKDN